LLHAELIAVADCDPARARSRGEAYGVPGYGDYHEMLRRHPEIEVIDVLTPTAGTFHLLWPDGCVVAGAAT